MTNRHTTHVSVVPRVVHVRPGTQTPWPYGVSPADVAAWSKVNICEESGNWRVVGPVYSGGLGISNTNWVAYGGTQFAPNASLASVVQQIAVAKRIQSTPPDQNGCSGAW